MISTEPTSDQLAKIAETELDQPFDMINLLKYRKVASYETDQLNALGRSGREAYAEYAKVVLPKILALGGEIAYRGTPQLLFVGDSTQDYDDLIVVRYPSRQAYLDMFNSSEYQRAIMHRKAGLEFRVLHVASPA